MVFASVLFLVAGVIALGGGVAALIIILNGISGKARRLGTIGAILLILGTVISRISSYVLPGLIYKLNLSTTRYTLATSTTNILFAIIEGLGVVLIALAATAAAKPNRGHGGVPGPWSSAPGHGMPPWGSGPGAAPRPGEQPGGQGDPRAVGYPSDPPTTGSE